jgi:L-asparaginase / beta-aspartyl-peptidase
MKKTWSLMIHGGAGELDRVRKHTDIAPYLESIKIILEKGNKLLKRGGTALDAVELCVSMLEDNSLFNAGRGAVLNESGVAELDAAIMDGKSLNAGAVAGLSHIANPVQLARLVLEKSNHVMLIANGAERFARQHDIKSVTNKYFITDKRLEEYKKLRAGRQIDKRRKHGTVGAVAMDKKGNLAAATSTGGLVCKQQGRVGDSPIIGAGTYMQIIKPVQYQQLVMARCSCVLYLQNILRIWFNSKNWMLVPLRNRLSITLNAGLTVLAV